MNTRMRKDFGARIAKLREERAMTQDAFAAMIGMNRGYLCGIENGSRNPSFDKIASIAQGLDVSLEYLMRGVGTTADDAGKECGFDYRSIGI